MTLSDDEKYRLWTPLSQISPYLIQATLLQEDRYFYYHLGVNPIALLRAGYETYLVHRRRMGGSTLTMQLARLRYGFSSKEAWGKVRQIAYALWLELHYSKTSILEAYLNMAPYGGNIEGVGAAARVYFGKAPNKLTQEEALSLAVIPQNPVARNLKKSRLEHSPTLKALPFFAPHFVNFLLAHEPNTQQEITTTLDLDLQKHVEKRIHDYLIRHSKQDIHNAAVLLLDYRSMGIKAWVGSANFFDKTIQGQVDGVLARRSPGSTLKPFVYALAIDQGLIHPGSLLKDVPYSKASYDPENFDQDFLGPVTAEEALNLSRNVPAVWLAGELKKPDLYDFLKKAGIFLPEPKTHYGLALALGGAELSMFELVELYTLLVNQGSQKELVTVQAPPTLTLPHKGGGDKSGTLPQGGGDKKVPLFEKGRSLVPPFEKGQSLVPPFEKGGLGGILQKPLSPQAAFLTLEMLRNNPYANWSYKNPIFPVYWKTGTSFGFKDAWTIGIFGQYLLAVWLGDFEGKSNPTLIGRVSAAPLFFDLVESLSARRDFINVQQRAPDGVKQIEVCALSGQMPGPFCPHTKKTWFIPGKSPIHTCTMHREVQLDNKTHLRVCRGFTGKSTRKVYEFWPSDLLEVYEQAGIKRETPPPFHPQCLVADKASLGNGTDLGPVIRSPQSNTVYHIRLSSTKTNRIPLKATTDAEVGFVYWFVDKAFVGKARKNEFLFWTAKVGTHRLTAVDDEGRSTSMQLVVKAVP